MVWEILGVVKVAALPPPESEASVALILFETGHLILL